MKQVAVVARSGRGSTRRSWGRSCRRWGRWPQRVADVGAAACGRGGSWQAAGWGGGKGAESATALSWEAARRQMQGQGRECWHAAARVQAEAGGGGCCDAGKASCCDGGEGHRDRQQSREESPPATGQDRASRCHEDGDRDLLLRRRRLQPSAPTPAGFPDAEEGGHLLPSATG